MKRTPQCYGCRSRPVRKGHRFCTQRCAADWAEELVLGNDDDWCPACEDWVSIAGGAFICEHGKQDLQNARVTGHPPTTNQRTE